MLSKPGDDSQIDWQSLLKSGNRIFIGSNAAVPNALVQDLIDSEHKLRDIEVVHILTLSDNIWAKPDHKELFKVKAKTVMRITSALKAFAATYTAALSSTTAFTAELSSLASASSEVARNTN